MYHSHCFFFFFIFFLDTKIIIQTYHIPHTFHWNLWRDKITRCFHDIYGIAELPSVSPEAVNSRRSLILSTKIYYHPHGNFVSWIFSNSSGNIKLYTCFKFLIFNNQVLIQMNNLLRKILDTTFTNLTSGFIQW